MINHPRPNQSMLLPFRIILVLLVSAACAASASAQRPREIWERYKIAFVGDNPANPLLGPAQTGAREAAKILDHQHNLEVTLVSFIPRDATGQAQVDALNEAFLEGVDGVILNVNDPALAGKQIDFLASQGIPTVTIENDAPASKRIATVMTDQAVLGELAFLQLLKHLPARGKKVIVLTSPDAEIDARLRALQQAAAGNDRVVLSVQSSAPTFDGGQRIIREEMENDRDDEIDGWIFLGPWPLLGVAQLPWTPDEQTCIAVDALPPMLPYLANGKVDAFIAQEYFLWGKLAMETLIAQIHLEEEPATETILTGAEVITQDDLAEYSRLWAEWMQ
ncbi:MAG: substrate-binding domain-containing protein [Puniceicoccales bacterium]